MQQKGKQKAKVKEGRTNEEIMTYEYGTRYIQETRAKYYTIS